MYYANFILQTWNCGLQTKSGLKMGSKWRPYELKMSSLRAFDSVFGTKSLQVAKLDSQIDFQVVSPASDMLAHLPPTSDMGAKLVSKRYPKAFSRNICKTIDFCRMSEPKSLFLSSQRSPNRSREQRLVRSGCRRSEFTTKMTYKSNPAPPIDNVEGVLETK